MGYVDLSTLHSPLGGQRPPAEWGRQVRDNLEFLARPPRCGLIMIAPQAVPTGAWTAIDWADEIYDYTTPLHSTVTNPSRITIPADLGGVWRFDVNGAFDSNGTGVRGIGLRKNGTGTDSPTHGYVFKPNNGAGNSWADDLGREVEMAEGDWMDVVAFQNSGGDLDWLDATLGASSFTAHLVALA